MIAQWNQPDVSTIHLVDGREVQAEVNGKSIFNAEHDGSDQ